IKALESNILGCLLWTVLFSPAVPMCLPSDFTLYVEKPECDFCVAINTTICMGFCRTKVVGPLLYQRSCTYDKVEYRTTMLPGCSANPLFTYPVALSCHCSTCRTENNDCAHRASPAGSRCTKPVRHIYPYPARSDYLSPF
uniref:Gonadotropin subunit beta-2 n=1 Tax=Neogobius melanostomus TaxID=47308 RepID=A0A8C6T494_9GOBI